MRQVRLLRCAIRPHGLTLDRRGTFNYGVKHGFGCFRRQTGDGLTEPIGSRAGWQWLPCWVQHTIVNLYNPIVCRFRGHDTTLVELQHWGCEPVCPACCKRLVP